ncbi:MAG: hypothetical protein HY822_15150 [Acidobacteria bacterium]|nr:hypothetical protein [Acidobacteriota bacterium]
MRKLRRDIHTHQRAAVLFFGYWLAALAAAFRVWFDSPPGAALLLSTPPITGALVGWWRSSDRIRGGMLAGALCGGITSLAMSAHAAINWIQRGRIHHGDEVLGFSIFLVVIGSLLGLVGAALATILDRFRCHGRLAPSP